MNVKVGTCEIELDSTKVISENDSEIVIPALLAREGVLPYAQGKAFRPADELKSSLFTFDGAWCVSKKHPEQMILTKPGEISGKISDVQWDEARSAVKGNVHLFKAKNDSGFLEDVKAGKLKDVSIGFLYEEDWQAGEWNKQKYDFVQRNILINHVAVGVPKGRMTSPSVGLGLDSSGAVHVGVDPWEETENSIRSGHGDKGRAETCRTKVINEGLSLVVCKDKESGKWFDQSFIFKKDQGWTMEKAKSWFSKHNADSLQLITQLALETMLYDTMTPDEIDAKILALEKSRDAFKQQIDDHYAEKRKKDAKLQAKIDAVNRKRDEDVRAIYDSTESVGEQEKLTSLYGKIDGLNAEIQAFREAKVQTIVAGNEAEWNPSADWPDSCYAYVPESAKGADGKKSDRKIPYKWPDGTIGPLNIIRNALARLAQEKTDIPDDEKARITKMLQGILKKANPDYTPSTDSTGGSGGASQTSPPPKPKEAQKPAPTTEEIISRNKTVRELASKVL
jgi:hypothetical protein